MWGRAWWSGRRNLISRPRASSNLALGIRFWGEKERRGLNEGGCLKSYEARFNGQHMQTGVLEVPGGQ